MACKGRHGKHLVVYLDGGLGVMCGATLSLGMLSAVLGQTYSQCLLSFLGL